MQTGYETIHLILLTSITVFSLLAGWIFSIIHMSKLHKRFSNLLHTLLLRKEKQAAFTLQLQAYERLALLLERINPPELMRRTISQNINLSIDEAYIRLMDVIRAEFMHNVTQQVYVSERTWQEVVNARDSVIEILTQAYKELKKHGTNITAGKYIQHVLKMMGERENPVEGALHVIREEVKKVVGQGI